MRGKSKGPYYGSMSGWLPPSVFPSEPGMYQIAGGYWRRFDGDQWFRGRKDKDRANIETKPALYAAHWKAPEGKHAIYKQPATPRTPKKNGQADPANFAPTDLWSAIAHVQTIAEQAGYCIEIKSVKRVEHGRTLD